VPYIIAGGYANTQKLLHKIELDENGQQLPRSFQTTYKELKFMAFNDQEPGFLRIIVDNKEKTLTSEYFLVPFDDTSFEKNPFDTVTVPW
jgi:hypothetical protein